LIVPARAQNTISWSTRAAFRWPLTGGNRNDVTQLLPLLDDLHARPVAGKVGRPRQKPDLVLANADAQQHLARPLPWVSPLRRR
jgi:hypothetical protein